MASAQSIPTALSSNFPSLGAARDAIRSYIVDRGESYRVYQSDRKRYVVVCRDDFCKFGIRAAALKGPKYCITRYIPHSCSPAVHKNFGQAHSVAFLVSRHRTAVVDNPEILPKQIQSVERIQHGNFGVSYQQAWRTREALRQELEGDEQKGLKSFPVW